MGLEALLSSQIIGLSEAIDDRTASLLVAGTGITLTYNDGAGTLTIAASGGLGGSTGSTDNRILRSDGTGGATVQNSAVTIDDSGNISGIGTLNTEGQATIRRVGGTAGTHEVQIYHDTNGGWVAERSSTRLNLVSGGSIIFGVNPGAPTNTGYGSISGSTLRIRSTMSFGFLNSTDPINGTVDVESVRNATGPTWEIRAAGGLRVCNFAGSAFANIALALLFVGTYTVATLPSASANAGALAQVTDSSVTTNGSTVSGSGSNRVVVFSNGTTWDVVVA